jgi:hypothetical protein
MASTCAERQTYINPHCKQPLKKAQSLKMSGHEISMKRANSFHHGSACQSNKATVQENEDNIEECGAFQYRTTNDHYQDEDELILPLFPAEQTGRIIPRKPCRPSESLSALDSLVISTSHSVSSKLCQTAARIVRQADNLFPEDDEEQALTIETVTYLLEDTNIPPSYRSRVSAELAGQSNRSNTVASELYPRSSKNLTLQYLTWLLFGLLQAKHMFTHLGVSTLHMK